MAISEQLRVVVDGNKNTVFCINPSQYVDRYSLTANTAKAITVPTGYSVAAFSCTASVLYVTFDGSTATVPGADIDDGSAPCLNPSVRNVAGISTLSVISTSNCVIVIEWFKLGGLA